MPNGLMVANGLVMPNDRFQKREISLILSPALHLLRS